MIKTCERCGGSFECLPEDIVNCSCSKINLEQQVREYLNCKYKDCLCSNCLIYLTKKLA